MSIPEDAGAPSVFTISADQLRRLLEDAAARGAQRTLARLGLDDEEAIEDMREVRDLLAAWRSARRVAWETVIRAVTMVLLAALAAGVAWQWLGDGRPPRPPGQ